MTSVVTPLSLGEFHEFKTGDVDFLYMVPSGGIFAVSPAGREYRRGGPDEIQQGSRPRKGRRGRPQ